LAGNGVLVIGELAGGAPAQATLEAIAAARALSAGPVSVALAGGPGAASATAKTAIAHGADAVYTVEHEVLASGAPDALVAAAEAVVKHVGPAIVLGARTLSGRDVLPRLAFRLGTALAADCSSVALDGQGRLLATRPVYGGNAEATVACLGRPAMASLRPKSVDALPADAARTGSVEAVDAGLSAETVRVRTVERVEAKAEGVRLEDARVVVSGGRGLAGPEPFAQLEALAGLLDGAVGASRAACDAGWIPSSHQVGLTGRTVTPEVYIAIGISGASQHMAGCSNAKAIVAINKDAGANIFKQARFGVTGDWRNVLPAFTEQLRELLG
jgi:electron transfer flavoprotein alpha subunit